MWPKVKEVQEYRKQVYRIVSDVMFSAVLSCSQLSELHALTVTESTWTVTDRSQLVNSSCDTLSLRHFANPIRIRFILRSLLRIVALKVRLESRGTIRFGALTKVKEHRTRKNMLPYLVCTVAQTIHITYQYNINTFDSYVFYKSHVDSRLLMPST